MSRERDRGDERAVVVLAHAQDQGAASVAQVIARRRGQRAVRIVRPAELAHAPCWTHAIDSRGRVTGEIVLASGRTIEAADVGSVFNRLVGIVPPAFARAPARERDYAAAEMHALVTSWLAGLGCPVVNPVASALGTRSRRQWLASAVTIGIPVLRDVVATSARLLPSELAAQSRVRGPWPDTSLVTSQPVEASQPYDQSPTRVLVAGNRAYGDISPALAAASVELAGRSGCSLLELSFVSTGGGPRLADADPLPPLLDHGAARVVADLLERSCAAIG